MARPAGTKNPDGRERIRRKIPHMMEALLTRALSGDPEAIKLCFMLVGEPIGVRKEVSTEATTRVQLGRPSTASLSAVR